MAKKKWIKSAINPAHKGQFRAKAKAAGESTKEFAESHKHDSGKTGSQARLALNLMAASGADKKSKRAKMYDHPRSPKGD